MDYHKFVSVPGKCAKVCSICGTEGGYAHDWDGDKCVKCGQEKEEFELLTEMLEQLHSADRLDTEEYLRSDSSSPNFITTEAVEIIQQVYKDVSEKYGQEGLDKMMTLVRGENSGAFLSFVEYCFQRQ